VIPPLHKPSPNLRRSIWSAARLRRAIVGMLAAVGLLHVVVELTPALTWWNRYLANPWDDRSPGEVMIVLGAEEIDGQFLGFSSYWRCLTAVREWRKGGFRRIVVSGGGGPPGNTAADIMREFIVFSGVPAAAVETETQSGSTRENALFTARRLAGVPGRKVLITSDYHMRRAYAAFRRAGLDVIGRPAPDAGKQLAHPAQRWPVLIKLTVETAKLAYYRAKGWI
jgi:uncharacterized SAM-binding protein YcdF (DUF218 family)